MTIKNLQTPVRPDAFKRSMQPARERASFSADSRLSLANFGDEGDAWLEPMLADFLSLACNVCNAPFGMMSQLHGDIGLHHPFVSVVNGRGDVRNQWWRFSGQNGVSRSAVDFSLCEAAARRGRNLTEISDLQADLHFGESELATSMPHVRFYAAMPLIAENGDALGTLCVMDRVVRHLSAAQRDGLQKLGRQLEAQLESHRTMQKLEQQTLTDSLTAIGNRRSFDLRLREEWTRHLRNARPLSMLMVDVDYFKQYNDTYGHPAGDALLTQLALVLRSPLRASDFLARYGGDEFSLILPDTDEIGAMQVADRIKQAVARVQWPHTEIEISLGAATVTPSEMCDFHALLGAADKAMYERKHGRAKNNS